MSEIQTSPGELVARLAELRKQIEAKNKELAALSSERDMLQEKLLRTLDELQVQRVAINGYTVSVTETTLPTVTDWDAFYQYIKDNDALYLLERRPTATAYRETLEARDGEPLPGVKSFIRRSISLRSS